MDLERIAGFTTVEDNLALLVAPDEVAEAQQISRSSPAMGMQWEQISGWNLGMKTRMCSSSSNR
jgi:hypothetical protein